jgi:hypothetical protein
MHVAAQCMHSGPYILNKVNTIAYTACSDVSLIHHYSFWISIGNALYTVLPQLVAQNSDLYYSFWHINQSVGHSSAVQ